MSIHRPDPSDSKQVEYTRKLVETSRSLLKQPATDMFIGRKTKEPPPTEDDAIERWINSPG